MPYNCPLCREEHERLWVVEDLDQPFGCSNCIKKRGLHAVAIFLAAREAWPDLAKDGLMSRIALALSEEKAPKEATTGLTGAAASVALIEAAGRLMQRRAGDDSPA